MKNAKTNRIVAALIMSVCFTLPVHAQNVPDQTLFTNVHVFYGVQDQRIENANVLIEGNLIKSISTDPIDAAGATVIDGGGRTLMPGLTDCQWHNMAAYMGGDVFAAGLGKLNLVAAHGAEKTLMRGFTSVRDPGGPVFDLKEAIDDGMFVGPRI